MPPMDSPQFSHIELKPSEAASPAESLLAFISDPQNREFSGSELAERNNRIHNTLDELEESSRYLVESIRALVSDNSDLRALQGRLLEECEGRCSRYLSAGGGESAIADILTFNSRLSRDRGNREAVSEVEEENPALKVSEALENARLEIERPEGERSAIEREKGIRQALAKVQDEFDGLRLRVKSLVHDIEATHRENDQVRADIERLT